MELPGRGREQRWSGGRSDKLSYAEQACFSLWSGLWVVHWVLGFQVCEPSLMLRWAFHDPAVFESFLFLTHTPASNFNKLNNAVGLWWYPYFVLLLIHCLGWVYFCLYLPGIVSCNSSFDVSSLSTASESYSDLSHVHSLPNWMAESLLNACGRKSRVRSMCKLRSVQELMQNCREGPFLSFSIWMISVVFSASLKQLIFGSLTRKKCAL